MKEEEGMRKERMESTSRTASSRRSSSSTKTRGLDLPNASDKNLTKSFLLQRGTSTEMRTARD